MRTQIVATAVIVAASLAVFGRITLAQQDRYTLKAPDGLAFSEFKGYDAWEDVAVSSPIPSFRPRQKSAKQPAPGQHFREPLHQRQQPMLRHVRDQFVEHAPLAEQRVGARL